MLIDEEMLYLEDEEEMDKIYHELKERSVRRRNMEEKENRLNQAMQVA